LHGGHVDEVKKITAQEFDAALNSLSNWDKLLTFRTLPSIGGAGPIDGGAVGARGGIVAAGWALGPGTGPLPMPCVTPLRAASI
jgi:hypothetical protein